FHANVAPLSQTRRRDCQALVRRAQTNGIALPHRRPAATARQDPPRHRPPRQASSPRIRREAFQSLIRPLLVFRFASVWQHFQKAFSCAAFSVFVYLPALFISNIGRNFVTAYSNVEFRTLSFTLIRFIQEVS